MAGGPVHILVWTLTWWFSPSLVLFVFFSLHQSIYPTGSSQILWIFFIPLEMVLLAVIFFHLGCLERRKRYLKNLDILLKYTCINVNQGVFKNRCYTCISLLCRHADFTFLTSSLQTTIHNLRHVWWESVIYVFLNSESFTVKRLISE